MTTKSCRREAGLARAQSARSFGTIPSLAVVAALALTLAPQARAQGAAAGKPVELPAIAVVEQSVAAPAAKAKRKTHAKKAPSQAPVPPAAAAQGAAQTSGNPLVNAGTPSDAVAPILGVAGNPGAQTATAIDAARLKAEPVFSVDDILRQSPGVSLKQGNGPRDLGVSIRGSNARNGFGIRNIVILEDGFPVTQPDGLSRSDLIDPHAYAGIDVWRGPSSALFGNYATGGAINFRTRPGGSIDGIEYGLDAGSFNYWNNYVAAGTKGANYEGSVFLSDVRGDGYFEYSAFNTQTVNALITVQASPQDKITLKAIDNELYTELPFRMSLNQFTQNPFQEGCTTAATAAAGCVTNSFSATNTTPKTAQTAAQAGANRDDRRTIGGLRWEHEFDAETSGRVQLVIDDRNISQPTGTTSAVGDYLSYNVVGDLTHQTTLAGLSATYTLAAFWNYLPVDSLSYNVAPGGGGALGKLQSNTQGSTANLGARAREEVDLSKSVIVTAGIGVERTLLQGTQTSFTYDSNGNVTGQKLVSADRTMTNVAPEVGVLWRPSREWQYRARVGTGYGTPQFTNLFVAPDGSPGNNTDLKSQENVGYDVGADWTPARGVMLSLTGFYEFFSNELVSQSAGPGLQSFSFNAPHSEHRGIEAAADVTIVPGLRLTAAYLYDDQVYTEYQERLSNSATNTSVLFDRAGNKIPGVSPHEVTARLSYDEPSGPLKGLGAFAEYQWHDAFFMENANLLEAPGYDVVDVNLHYTKEFTSGPMRSATAYFQVSNLFDERYISAANNITDTLAASGNQNPASVLANTSGSIYSGVPRTYYGGFRMKF